MGDLVVKGHSVFTPPVVFAEKEAMVRADNEHRIIPKIQLIHLIQYASKMLIAETQVCRILITNMLDRVSVGFVNRTILRPINMGSVIIVWVQ